MRGRSLMLTLLATVALGGLSLAFAPGVAHAQESPSRTTVSIDFQDADVRESLRQMFRTSKASFTVDPKVQGTVTLSVKNVPFDTALESVVRQVEATYRVEGGVYKIVPKEGESETALPVTPMAQSGYERTMVQDNGYLYVLAGNTVYKIDKGSMAVSKKAVLQ